MTRALILAALLALAGCSFMGKTADCMANPDLPCETDEES